MIVFNYQKFSVVFSSLLSNEADLISHVYILLLIEEVKYFKDTGVTTTAWTTEGRGKWGERDADMLDFLADNVLRMKTLQERDRYEHIND